MLITRIDLEKVAWSPLSFISSERKGGDGVWAAGHVRCRQEQWEGNRNAVLFGSDINATGYCPKAPMAVLVAVEWLLLLKKHPWWLSVSIWALDSGVVSVQTADSRAAFPPCQCAFPTARFVAKRSNTWCPCMAVVLRISFIKPFWACVACTHTHTFFGTNIV